MSKAEFTPGPWWAVRNFRTTTDSYGNPVWFGQINTTFRLSKTGYHVFSGSAFGMFGRTAKEAEANAILISKAPDLYDRVEELTDALSIWEGEGTLPKEWEKLLSDAVDTLREARGEK